MKTLLPFNYRQLLAEKFNHKYSPSYIGKVINGKRKNVEITQAAIDLIKSKQQEEELLQEELSLISKRYDH